MASLDEPFALHRLDGLPSAFGAAVRGFCLGVIEDVFGYAYRPDWHADLDGLAGDGAANLYAAARCGGFLVALDRDGAVAGTAGFHALALRPALAARLCARYPDPAGICQVARVYVRADRRGAGLGTVLHAAVRVAVADAGYRTLYLHAAAQEARTLAFWRGQGYAAFGAVTYQTADGRSEGAIDFDRPVA